MDHYNIEINDKRLKDKVKSVLETNLYDMIVLLDRSTAGGIADHTAGVFLSLHKGASPLHSRRN